jgi:S-adenosyl-L-methionine hydrolase (adenosine-forming)
MPIVLMTDFGLHDHTVGVMKGVIAGIAPDAQVIDLTHGIDAGAVHVAARALQQSIRYFPIGTIFCVVVGADAGVRPIAIETGGYWFIGPDNGVLSHALYGLPPASAVDATNALGEDEAPGSPLYPAVAALLHAGAPLETLGDPIREMVGLDM